MIRRYQQKKTSETAKKIFIWKYNIQMDLQFNLETNRRSTYSDLVLLSSDEDEMMSDGISVISTDTEAKIEDMETQMMALNVDSQMVEPREILTRPLTMGHYDPEAPSISVMYYVNMLRPTSCERPQQVDTTLTGADPVLPAHPIAAFSSPVPFVDTPKSPPEYERGFMIASLDDLSATPINSPNSQASTITTTHVGNLPQPSVQNNNGAAHGFSTDCFIFGKPYEQITDELVID